MKIDIAYTVHRIYVELGSAYSTDLDGVPVMVSRVDVHEDEEGIQAYGYHMTRNGTVKGSERAGVTVTPEIREAAESWIAANQVQRIR